MMIILVLACFAVVALMMRGAAQRPQGAKALEILRERYACGEINETEFEQRRRLIEQS